MKKTLTIVTTAIFAISLSSCTNMTHEQRRAAQGAAAGAVLGGVVGNQSGNALEGAALGAAAGGGAGYLYGRSER